MVSNTRWVSCYLTVDHKGLRRKLEETASIVCPAWLVGVYLVPGKSKLVAVSASAPINSRVHAKPIPYSEAALEEGALFARFRLLLLCINKTYECAELLSTTEQKLESTTHSAVVKIRLLPHYITF